MPTGGYAWFVWAEFALAVLTIVALQFVVAPYGRHERRGWGPSVPARVGWIVMETPAVYLFTAFYVLGAHRADPVPLVLLGLWLVHYVNRAIVTPLITPTLARMPVVVMLAAMSFNALNAWVNGRWVSEYGVYPVSWFTDPRFWIGLALMAAGFVGNVRSDAILRALRRERVAAGRTAYAVPQRGLFRLVSSPNYLCEIVEWIGWAVLTWSVAGAAFAAYTIANLAPRAIAHHRWYRDTFPDYPRSRRALIPFVL